VSIYPESAGMEWIVALLQMRYSILVAARTC
jgi:hypothetical protein